MAGGDTYRPSEAGGRGVLSLERHVWACALAIERQYGGRAPLHVAERIGALALAGDAEGVLMWKAIAARLALLTAHDAEAGGT